MSRKYKLCSLFPSQKREERRIIASTNSKELVEALLEEEKNLPLEEKNKYFFVEVNEE